MDVKITLAKDVPQSAFDAICKAVKQMTSTREGMTCEVMRSDKTNVLFNTGAGTTVLNASLIETQVVAILQQAMRGRTKF